MTTYYAIGDVHGECARLEELHAFIRADIADNGHDYKIVHVGDLVDRGPDSRGVIQRIMALHEREGERAITIRGNHEELMLHAYDNHESVGIYHWATNGGDETIFSYQMANGPHDDWRQSIDKSHIAWLRTLPTIWRDEERRLAFVHGGIDPKTFPDCTDEIRLWTRSQKFFDPNRWPERPELEGLLVVHGHTPTDDFRPHVNPRRINVDTGACFGGRLTCVVLAPGQAPRFLTA
ncbi:metallophosphoesterase family protein [Terricaulis sp.]|uniref:metallophosphoesterase family protein n=1 Tax=Terricaulis sp. TaxID=2768686 RepID=UPI0037840914